MLEVGEVEVGGVGVETKVILFSLLKGLFSVEIKLPCLVFFLMLSSLVPSLDCIGKLRALFNGNVCTFDSSDNLVGLLWSFKGGFLGNK